MGTIAYFMIGFTTDPGLNHFSKYIIILLVFAAEMGLLCLMFAILFKDIGTSTLVGSIVILFQMLFSGLLINQGISKCFEKYVYSSG
jgi:NADH:ubiquinone oxidoreductase subunit 3 (subunit A)